MRTLLSLRPTQYHTAVNIAILMVLISVTLAIVTARPALRPSTQSSSAPAQMAFFGYWSEDDGFQSTVVINNASNSSLTVDPLLYNLAGQPLAVSPIVLAPRQQIIANVADWLGEGGAGPEFKQGNLVLNYEAPDAAYLGAQVTVTDAVSSLSYDFRDEMPMSFKSSRLEGMWWKPDGASRYDLVLSNMKDSNVSVTVRASGGQGQADEFSFDVSLMSHQTQIISLEDKSLPFTTTEGAGKVGGISITHTGSPGAVLAYGMLSKNETGFSSNFTFEDPATVRSHATIGPQVLAGTHLLTGKPDVPGFPAQSSFTSIALFRNASESAIEVRPSVSFNSKGGPLTVLLSARMLAPNQVEALNIGSELKRSGIRGAVTGCGLTLTSNGQPGALVAHLTSFDQTRNHAFDVPMKDPAISMNRLSGSYPWRIDDDYQSIIHVRNITDEKARLTIQLDFEAGSYTLPLQLLEPQQEVAVDIRQLRDAQVKDSIQRVIPLEETQGQVTWSERGRQALIGRVEVFSVSKGTSSSFSCGGPCCPPDTELIYITPGSFVGVVGDGGAAQAFELQQRDCDGAQFGPFDISSGAQWSSTNTQVATVDGTEVSCVGVGVADVNVSYSGSDFLYNTTTECCDANEVPFTSQVPVVVVQVTFQKSDGTALPNPFRVGISATTLGGVVHDRTQHLRAVIAPAAEAANVTITSNNKLTVTQGSSSNGVINFDVVGKNKSDSHGDGTITAKHSGMVIGTAPVDVLVPNNVSATHDTAGAGLVIANRALDASTSPGIVCLPPGQVQLSTIYVRFLTVTVRDQFGGLIGDLYEGAEVSELAACDGLYHSINQVLDAASTYLDPVGAGVGSTQVAAGSSAANNWPTQPRNPAPSGCVTPPAQNISVRVDGFNLNPAIANRAWTICGDGVSSTSPPVTLTITWP